MFETQNEPSVKEASRTILTDELKEFIVRGLARYETPSQVAESVQAIFGVTVSRQQVYRYDPACSQPPAQRWRDLHAVTRAKFLSEIAEIGVAHRAVRLRRLERRASRRSGNWAFSCLMKRSPRSSGSTSSTRPSSFPRRTCR